PVNLGGGGASPNEVQEAFVSTYYPGVTDIGQAMVLEVRPGDEISAIDLTIGHQQVYRIRGRVIDGRTGQPPPSVSLSISSRTLTGGGFTMFAQNQRYNSTDGSFEMRDVTPGAYVIGATGPDPVTGSINTSPSSTQQPRIQAPVS